MNYLNGTTSTFYSYAGKEQIYQNGIYDVFTIKMWISSEVDIYDQYEITVPTNITRRNLQNSTNSSENTTIKFSDEEMDTVLLVFHLLAQMGGLFIIGQLIFGFVLRRYQRKLFMFNSVQAYHSFIS